MDYPPSQFSFDGSSLPQLPTLGALDGLISTTNTPISPAAGLHISSFIRQVTSNIEQLDANSNSLNHSLSSLRNLKTLHLALLSQLKTLSSSIRRLPNELLRLVFQEVQNMDVLENSKQDSFLPERAPFVLSQVCRDWRAIALTTPSLWSWISLAVSEMPCEETTLMLVYTWIQRSASSPLTIDLFMDLIPSGEEVSNNTTLLNLLVSQIRRWQSVKLILPIDVYFRTSVLRSTSTSAPLLRTIWLEGFGWSDSDAPTGTTMWLRNTPALEEITIRPQLGPHISEDSLEWATPSRLHLASIAPITVAQILSRSARNLRSLELASIHARPNPPFDTESPVVLPALQRLHFSWSRLDILTKIRTPALEELTLTRIISDVNSGSDIISSLVSCSPRLTNVEINDAVNPAIFQNLRKSTPIQRLKLFIPPTFVEEYLSFFREQFIDNPRNPSEITWGELLHLHIVLSAEDIIDITSLKEVVQLLAERFEANPCCPRLRSLTLDVSRVVTPTHPGGAVLAEIFSYLRDQNIPGLQVVY